MEPTLELILYACPVGVWAQQLDRYFALSLEQFGPNTAHRYLPHCSLTGFFKEWQSVLISGGLEPYQTAIASAFADYQASATRPLEIQQLSFQPHWHGLALQSPWMLEQVQSILDVLSDYRTARHLEAMRPKTWLHLSLAYDFSPVLAANLEDLAREVLDLTQPVEWEVRFYQRLPRDRWQIWGEWPLY